MENKGKELVGMQPKTRSDQDGFIEEFPCGCTFRIYTEIPCSHKLCAKHNPLLSSPFEIEELLSLKDTLRGESLEDLLTFLCHEQVELGEALEFYAEEGNKEGWLKCKAEKREIEDKIFDLTGQRPPYCSGWGQMGGHL